MGVDGVYPQHTHSDPLVKDACVMWDGCVSGFCFVSSDGISCMHMHIHAGMHALVHGFIAATFAAGVSLACCGSYFKHGTPQCMRCAWPFIAFNSDDVGCSLANITMHNIAAYMMRVAASAGYIRNWM